MTITYDQAVLFALFGLVFGFLIWGRLRYDFVAFSALMAAIVLGVVPAHEAFSGFGHPAVILIALVLVVSRGLMNSGAIELVAARLLSTERGLCAHIGMMSVASSALSAVINNVAALALLMPLDLEAAKKANRAVSKSLMPLSFASILGGMITLIGTPPNIVVAQYREDAMGDAFSMFDFTPVGLVVAAFGIAFVVLVGWRLLPERHGGDALKSTSEAASYVVELKVVDKSAGLSAMVEALYGLADEHDVNLLGVIRAGRRLPGLARQEVLREGDYLVVEGSPKAIETFMGSGRFAYAGSNKDKVGLASGSLRLSEAIVPDGARIAYRSALDVRLLYRMGVTLLGVSRQGRRFRDRVRQLQILPGDVLLILGRRDRSDAAMTWLGVLPLEGRRIDVAQRSKALLALGSLFGAVALAVAGLVDLSVALAIAALVMCATGLVSGTEAYECVEWKVIVLLAALIPMGQAFEASGGAALLANSMIAATQGWPSWAILAVLMVATMTLSDFLNNVATCLIAAPIGFEIANTLGVNPDPFLMGVAVAASCAFLTPIGHKNNTIVMGPGGYHFGDYWRMGLPLEILVLGVSIPLIPVIWPF